MGKIYKMLHPIYEAACRAIFGNGEDGRADLLGLGAVLGNTRRGAFSGAKPKLSSSPRSSAGTRTRSCLQ